MHAFRARIDCQTCCRSFAAETRAVPTALRCIDNIAWIRRKERHAFDQIVDLAFENEPELRIADVEVPEIRRRRWWRALPSNDVCERLVVLDEGTAATIGANHIFIEI